MLPLIVGSPRFRLRLIVGVVLGTPRRHGAQVSEKRPFAAAYETKYNANDGRPPNTRPRPRDIAFSTKIVATLSGRGRKPLQVGLPRRPAVATKLSQHVDAKPKRA